MSNSPARHRASSTSRRCPVDSAATGRSARSAIPASAIACSAAALRLCRSRPGLGDVPPGPPPACPASGRGTRSPARSASRTAPSSGRSGRGRAGPGPPDRAPDMSAPCRRTVPLAGRTRPEATLNSVVLPAPFGPIRPVIRPTGAVRLTSLTATCPPYLTVTWARSRPGRPSRPAWLARPEWLTPPLAAPWPRAPGRRRPRGRPGPGPGPRLGHHGGRAAAADPVEEPVQPLVAWGEADRHLHRRRAEQDVQPVVHGRRRWRSRTG